MNERIKTIAEQIIQIIEYIGQKMGIAINWTGENVIPILENICKKYITWEIVTSIAWILFFSIPLLFMLYWNKNFRNRTKGKNKEDFSCDEDDEFICMFVGFIITSVISLITTMIQTFDIIRCVVFPELEIFRFIETISLSLK